MDQLIKKRQFKRSLVSQPFFIWNSLKDKVIVETDEEAKIELFWGEKLDDEAETTNQVMARTFKIIDEFLLDRLLKSKACEIIKGSLEERIAKTKALLSSDKLLINPAFIYKGAVSTPFAFDSGPKEIINIKYSSKTKVNKEFLEFYFDYMIISKNTEVHDCILYLPRKKLYKKHEIELRKVNSGSMTRTGSDPDEVDSKGNDKSIRFIDAFAKGTISLRGDNALAFPDFDKQLELIDNAREIHTVDNDLSKDITEWGTNPEWDELLVQIGSYLALYNAKVFKKSYLTDDDNEKKRAEKLLTMKWFISHDSPPTKINDSEWSAVWTELSELEKTQQVYVDKKKLKPYYEIHDSSKVVWYDFEGFSLPFAPIDNVMPYGQLVFQVSTIVTKDNIETEKENLVIDPLKLSSDDFIKISKAIYRKDAQKYVVYNKAYELSRLKEMQNILFLENHPDYEEFKKHYDHIKANTVDLCDLFIIASKNKLPAIMLYDQKARYSIKNVEKHISNNKIALPRPIFPYKDLAVSNGTMAMKLAIDRALDIIGEKQWREFEVQLKKYCENDVRAMIMVYDYVTYLLEQHA